MNGLIIAVDGMPGTGKTTVCKQLANAFGSTYTKEPYVRGHFGRAYDLLYNPSHSQRTRAFLMMAQRSSHLEAVSDIPRAPNEPVIFDRYILTTVGHQAESIADAHQLYHFQKIAGFPLPDLQIYLTASKATRIARMESRGESDSLDAMNTESLEEHFQHGLKEMIKDGVRVSIINTEGQDFAQVFTLVQDEIKEICRGEYLSDDDGIGDARDADHPVDAV